MTSSLLITSHWGGDQVNYQALAASCAARCAQLCAGSEGEAAALLSPHRCVMLGLSKLSSSTPGPRFESRKLIVLKRHNLVTKARCMQGQALHPVHGEGSWGLSCS